MYQLNQIPEFINEQNLALLVTLTIVLVGLTFAITIHLLFKMQNEIRKLRAEVQVETEQISAIKEEIVSGESEPAATVEYTQTPPPPAEEVIPNISETAPPVPPQH